MVNDRLRTAMEAAGLTADAVATQLDVDAKTVERWIATGRSFRIPVTGSPSLASSCNLFKHRIAVARDREAEVLQIMLAARQS